MSLYQSQAYAHMGYPTPPAYPQQPLPPPNYYPPPPQPVYYADPNHFRRDYAARLAQLTVNSRPIIQSLSMLAQEYVRFADIVVQCIEQHIRRVPHWMKLPAFYLLDAISKNVYEPYARHFIPVVVRLFLDTYEQVDPSTRSKMEEMLLTWRTGAPNRTQLFGVVPQTAIERHIWPDSTQEPSGKVGQPSISAAQVLSELEFVLSAKQRALQTNPYEKQTQNHVSVLYQLRNLVQAGVSQEELGQILTQLRTMAPAPPPAPVAPIPPVAPVSQAYPPASYPPSGAQSSYPAAQPPYPPATYASSAESPNAPVQAAPVAQSSSGASTSAPSIPVNVSSLFSALVKAGVVSASASSTPTGAGATVTEQSTNASLEGKAAQDYRRAILAVGIRLTATDIARHRPPVSKFLYDNLAGQCKQCGIRFRGDADGKKRLEAHLDMHFAQNRKASQAAGRGYSRGWFVPIDDWLHDGAVDVKGKGRADRVSMKGVTAEEAARRDADLRTMFVVVPPGDEAKPVSCPICKETLKSEFLEDDEEWVWRNAVKKDDRIYHATCHSEAISTKSSLVTRLRTEMSSSRSRSRTPEVARSPPREEMKLQSQSPPTTPTRGTKRKAEDDEPRVKTEGGSTPPSKKLALSP